MLLQKDISRLNLKQLSTIEPHFDKPGARNQVTLELIQKEIQRKSRNRKPTKSK